MLASKNIYIKNINSNIINFIIYVKHYRFNSGDSLLYCIQVFRMRDCILIVLEQILLEEVFKS